MGDQEDWEVVDGRQQWAVLYVRHDRSVRDVLVLRESEQAARQDFAYDSESVAIGRANSRLVLMVREGSDESWGAVGYLPTRSGTGSAAR